MAITFIPRAVSTLLDFVALRPMVVGKVRFEERQDGSSKVGISYMQLRAIAIAFGRSVLPVAMIGTICPL